LTIWSASGLVRENPYNNSADHRTYIPADKVIAIGFRKLFYLQVYIKKDNDQKDRERRNLSESEQNKKQNWALVILKKIGNQNPKTEPEYVNV
jgi:hypothetical protein